jgi:hypothetical protein
MNQLMPVQGQRPPAAATPRLSRFAQFRNLSRAQKRVLIAAWLWLPVFWIGLRALGPTRFHSRLQRKPIVVQHASPMTQDEIRSFAETVNIAARHTPFPATCLSRSLLLSWLLRRHGVASELRIGVKLNAGTLLAHAWVECGGHPVNDRADIADEFHPFASQPPMTAFSAT